jgi:DNA-binding IclR family transcriptional regulator
MDVEIDLETLILATICVAEQNGSPLTAIEIAFLLDVPREDTIRMLAQLMADRTVKTDGDVFRLRRSLTPGDLARIDRLRARLEQLRPIVEMLPVRLHS